MSNRAKIRVPIRFFLFFFSVSSATHSAVRNIHQTPGPSNLEQRCRRGRNPILSPAFLRLLDHVRSAITVHTAPSRRSFQTCRQMRSFRLLTAPSLQQPVKSALARTEPHTVHCSNLSALPIAKAFRQPRPQSSKRLAFPIFFRPPRTPRPQSTTRRPAAKLFQHADSLAPPVTRSAPPHQCIMSIRRQPSIQICPARTRFLHPQLSVPHP